MTTTETVLADRVKLRLWLEFIAIFVALPLMLAFWAGPFPLFPVLLGFTVIAVGLLWITPGFEFRSLLGGPVLAEWRIILIFALVTGIGTVALALALVPERFLELPRNRTGLWLMIMTLYPLVSVLPQELIYRTLFFRRYGRLFPNVGTAVVVNGVAFALGHAFFLNWITIGLTGLGGLIIAWAYMRHKSFLLAVVLHALAGQLIFTSGLGIFFYHGAIGATP